MVCIMMDHVVGHDTGSLSGVDATGVEIATEWRKRAAGDMHSNPVPDLEYVRGRPKVHFEFVDLTRAHQLWLFK